MHTSLFNQVTIAGPQRQQAEQFLAEWSRVNSLSAGIENVNDFQGVFVLWAYPEDVYIQVLQLR